MHIQITINSIIFPLPEQFNFKIKENIPLNSKITLLSNICNQGIVIVLLTILVTKKTNIKTNFSKTLRFFHFPISFL